MLLQFLRSFFVALISCLQAIQRHIQLASIPDSSLGHAAGYVFPVHAKHVAVSEKLVIKLLLAILNPATAKLV